ncbi:MAG: 3-deoxy-D-manno-octulosonic acid transferase [Gammaproteobacteria bacterium]|nr:3-deoxy-D-manno-octulosonic acid transferase [Gammaproteobacteria bacterium]
MRFLYSCLFYLLTPAVLVRLLWRGFRAPAYWRRWPERFGFFKPLPVSQTLWIHAVSFGEVQAAVPLVKALRARYPEEAVLITAMTPTGSRQVREVFGDSVQHVYLSYDLPGAVRRFLVRTKPRIGIIMETELWPNLFHACKARGIPLVLANARLSARSANGYRYTGSLINETLACLSQVAAQTAADAERLISLGAAAERVRITGSVKFDIRLPANLAEQAKILRETWGTARAVWIAASTHEGEDEQVLEAFALIKKSVAHGLLILVPRHPERFKRVASLCVSRGYKLARRSAGEVCTAETEVYLGDTMGELLVLYAASDAAFIGGSLAPVGGHNPLEPAALGLPVLMGPHMFNFQDISLRLQEDNAARQVHTAKALAGALLDLFGDAELRTRTGENGRLFVERNRGALERLLTIVFACL